MNSNKIVHSANLFRAFGVATIAAALVSGGANLAQAAADSKEKPALAPVSEQNASLKMTLDELAIKFARKLNPPFHGSDGYEAKRFLKMHVPPLEPFGGWDRKDQMATRTDLTVLICKKLRLTVQKGQEENPSAYWQALLDFTGSQDPEAVRSVLGLFKDSWIAMMPVEQEFLTESERSILAFGFNLVNTRPPMDPPRTTTVTPPTVPTTVGKTTVGTPTSP